MSVNKFLPWLFYLISRLSARQRPVFVSCLTCLSSIAVRFLPFFTVFTTFPPSSEARVSLSCVRCRARVTVVEANSFKPETFILTLETLQLATRHTVHVQSLPQSPAGEGAVEELFGSWKAILLTFAISFACFTTSLVYFWLSMNASSIKGECNRVLIC